MSYILDALRKADAERERDPARGIHAQPMAPLPAARRSFPVAWLAAGVAVIAAAAGAYALRSPQPSPVAARAAAAVAAAGPVQPLAPVVAPAPVVANAVQPPAPPMPVPAAVRPAAPARPQAVALAKAEAAPAVVLKAPAPVAAQPEAAQRVLAYSELPPDVQGALPKLAITGGVHSDNAAQRMLIVGGQVFAEGAELAPGVLLEQIRPKAAVLKFRGYRYSVFY